MSSDDYDDYDDEEFDDIDEEEWEYFREEEREALKDRVSIKDIIKLVLMFVFFVAFFVYFRFYDSIAEFLAFGSDNVEIGYSRLLYFTLVAFPVLGAFFLVGLVNVSKTLFIPRKESLTED
ncbi:MAG: hypothetical protein FK731_03715 [Asgard group archaeon]|nr:hypothetical protein [Asgard group archaeon]